MKDLIEAIVFVLICPLGWIGMMFLALLIDAVRG